MTRKYRALVAFVALILPEICFAAAPQYGFMGPTKAQLEALMDVTYFLVPRTELAQAVVSREAAAAIEATTFGDPSKRRELHPYSVIVFAQSAYTASHAYGRIRLKIAGHKRSIHELDIPSLSIGTDSVFVIDGGNRMLGPLRGAKSVEWLRLKSTK